MEGEGYREPEKRRRKRCLILCAVLIILAIITSVLAVVLSLRQDTDTFQDTFIARCKKFEGYDCQKVWEAFQQAYVGQDPCQVPAERYDPLVKAAASKPTCNRVMLWSKTKDVVHDFTEKRDCFKTLEDTLLGSVLDGLTWCGKEGSEETFTTGCPGWTECENNTVRSFWNRASAGYADVACGDVSAMLNGSLATPFSPLSIFGSVEVKRLSSDRVKSLNVVLVTQPNDVTNCSNPSFNDLQKELDKGVKYNCKEVPISQVEECGSDPEKPCGSCW